MSAPTVTTEKWALLTAALAAAAALAKKFLPRPKPKPEFITGAEFHQAMDKNRDRIGASFLVLAEKMDQQHNHLLTRLDHQAERFEARIDQLESNLARLDERTRSA